MKPYALVIDRSFKLRVGAEPGLNEMKTAVRWAVFGEQVHLSVSKPGIVLPYWEELFLPWNQFKRVGQSESWATL